MKSTYRTHIKKRPQCGRFTIQQWAEQRALQGTDFRRLRTLGAILDFELDLLAFVQAAIATTLNSGEVSKNVTAASIGGNETEAFFGIEPLNFALLNHDMERPKNKTRIALHQERKTRDGIPGFQKRTEGDVSLRDLRYVGLQLHVTAYS